MAIKLLDCTLRDGGYVNEWKFGNKTISKIVENLTSAGMDFIEIGFMKSKPYNPDASLFRYVSDFKPFIPEDRQKSKYYGMITYGDYNLDDIPHNDGSSIDGLRIIFKKKDKNAALEYCQKAMSKGYEIFINPTFMDQYSDSELLELIKEVNLIHPTGFSIVDSMGVMDKTTVVRMFMLINHNLLPDIKVCFHSHNNLQQSFQNAVALIDCHSNRELIIDVSVMGMGRGAGNLNAELMISHLNENHGTNYNLLPILKIADEHIVKIFALTPWGYSLPYFLAASTKCHPNYASYLVGKQTISIDAMNAILLRIPDNKKATYDVELIKQLYLDYQENAIDDSLVLEKLKKQIAQKNILIVGPGKTIKTHKTEIDTFIAEKNPFVISLNFRPDLIKTDKIFVTSPKRFENINDYSNVIATSNIKAENIMRLNYASYLNNSEKSDDCLLMLLNVLKKICAKKVWLAGLDGFDMEAPNYADFDMNNNSSTRELAQLTPVISKMLKQYAKQISICFITPSLYEQKQ